MTTRNARAKACVKIPCQRSTPPNRHMRIPLRRTAPENRSVLISRNSPLGGPPVCSFQRTMKFVLLECTCVTQNPWKVRYGELGYPSDDPIRHGDVLQAHDYVSAEHLHQPVVARVHRKCVGLEAAASRFDSTSYPECVGVLEKCRTGLSNRTPIDLFPSERRASTEVFGLFCHVSWSVARVCHENKFYFMRAYEARPRQLYV